MDMKKEEHVIPRPSQKEGPEEELVQRRSAVQTHNNNAISYRKIQRHREHPGNAADRRKRGWGKRR